MSHSNEICPMWYFKWDILKHVRLNSYLILLENGEILFNKKNDMYTIEAKLFLTEFEMP